MTTFGRREGCWTAAETGNKIEDRQAGGSASLAA